MVESVRVGTVVMGTPFSYGHAPAKVRFLLCSGMDEATRLFVGQGIFLLVYFITLFTNLWQRLHLPGDVTMAVLLGLNATILSLLGVENAVVLWLAAGAVALVVGLARVATARLALRRVRPLSMGGLAVAAFALGTTGLSGALVPLEWGLVVLLAATLGFHAFRPAREAQLPAVTAGDDARFVRAAHEATTEVGEFAMLGLFIIFGGFFGFLHLLRLNHVLQEGVTTEALVQLAVVGAYLLGLLASYTLIVANFPRIKRMAL